MLFAGTPDFALASLTALVDAGMRPVAVFTQPDRPAGRGKRLTASPVKRYAVEAGIDVFQPDSLRDPATIEAIRALEPEIIVVAAYGLILPDAVLSIPAHGCLNVHASLLPRWRGAAPIQAAILAGDREAGVSLMEMTSGLDCGPVYVTSSVEIAADETAGRLHDRLAALGAELLVKHLGDIVAGRIDAREQDESRATYAPKIDKRDARLDWRLSAGELERRVRAYNPLPGAWFELGGMRVKCWRATLADAGDAGPGQVLLNGKGGFVVACGEGALRLESVQRPGRRPVTGAEFLASVDVVGKAID